MSSRSSGGLASLSSRCPHATSHRAEHRLRTAFSQGQQTRALSALSEISSGNGRDTSDDRTPAVWQRPLPLAGEKGTNHHTQAPVWMDAGLGKVPADDLQQGQSKEQGALAWWPSGKLLLSRWGSKPAPAAPSHLPCSSSPAGKGKPGISCSQHIPGIYLVGLPLRRPLLMKDTDLEQASG